MPMTKAEVVCLLGGYVAEDYRFRNTPVPWVAMLPEVCLIGFGQDPEEAARDVLNKRLSLIHGFSATVVAGAVKERGGE